MFTWYQTLVISGITAAISGIGTSLINSWLYKRKNQVEVEGQVLQNVSKVTEIWQGIAEEWKQQAIELKRESEQLRVQAEELAQDVSNLKNEIKKFVAENEELKRLVAELKTQIQSA